MSPFVGATATPPPAGVIPNLQNPTDVLRTVAIVTNGLALGLTTLVTVGRFYVRVRITRAVFLEDWFCALSWILSTVFCILGLLSPLTAGGGYHAWDVSPATLVQFQRIQYAVTILYGPTVWCIKVALLLILVRVFTPFKRIIWAVWGFIFAMLVYYIIATALKIFICTPLSKFWDPNVQGKCANENLLFTIDTVWSILMDVIILVLPIPLVWSLQVPTTKKIRTIALLGAGGLATAAGITRLILVLDLDDSPYQLGDPTVSLLRINLLVTAELSLGIICACLPAFNIFFTAERQRSRQRSTYLSHSNSSSKHKQHARHLSKSSLKLPDLPVMSPIGAPDVVTRPEKAVKRDSWPLRNAGVGVKQDSEFRTGEGEV
ncbi:uncharacterized protein RSE6_08043 [Rhynchosporium secalis]|uniref:Rhodopsin domain-containing protein n=1 Tax=Rhynchosporium secalis TaxID=38038 RepID=A0A1E1MEG4_RHYSE|nr:uncharacterized protein RSE6_08043 [Rhynchosporium secalis]